jgi:hypothetical protein
MLFHVSPEAQRISYGDKVPAVGCQVLIHIDHYEVMEADPFPIAAVRQDLILANGPNGENKDDFLPSRRLGGKIFLEQIGGKPGDQGVIVGKNLDGDTGFISKAVFGNLKRIHACRLIRFKKSIDHYNWRSLFFKMNLDSGIPRHRGWQSPLGQGSAEERSAAPPLLEFHDSRW